MPDLNELRERAILIRDETQPDANTAVRVGQLLLDMLDVQEPVFDITPTRQEGDIRPGLLEQVTSQELWRLSLEQYQAPAVSSFTLAGSGSRTLKRGAAVAPNPAAAATWTTSAPANVRPGTVSLRDVTAAANLALGLDAAGSVQVSLAGYTVGIGEARRYQLSGTDVRNNTFSAILAVNGLPGLLFGASALTPAEMLNALASGQPLTPARLAALGLEETLQEGRVLNRNYNCSGGKYIYVAWDEAYGPAPTLVRSGLLDFSAYTVSPAPLTDEFGIARAYRLLYTGFQNGANVNLNILA